MDFVLTDLDEATDSLGARYWLDLLRDPIIQGVELTCIQPDKNAVPPPAHEAPAALNAMGFFVVV